MGEAVPPELGHFVTTQLDIPVYGIGGGWAMDGQLLIIADLLGEFQAFTPKFVTKKCNLAEMSVAALKEYVADVKSKAFPLDAHCYHCKKEEMPKVEELFKQMAKKPDKICTSGCSVLAKRGATVFARVRPSDQACSTIF